jgi:hypothetical protein
MFGRLVMAVSLVALGACANIESAGRNAARAPQASSAERTAPPPVRTVELPQPQANTGPVIAPAADPRPNLTAPPALVTPTPQRSAAATAPPAIVPTPAPEPVAPPVAAPEVRVPVSTTPPPRPRSDGDDIIVPGQAQEQVRAPDGDFRSREQRNEDIRAWDRCVSSVQAVFERDPMRPQLNSPEDYCSQSLGMSDRDAIPESRLRRVGR